MLVTNRHPALGRRKNRVRVWRRHTQRRSWHLQQAYGSVREGWERRPENRSTATVTRRRHRNWDGHGPCGSAQGPEKDGKAPGC